MLRKVFFIVLTMLLCIGCTDGDRMRRDLARLEARNQADSLLTDSVLAQRLADDHSLRRAKLINYLYETADYGACRIQSTEALDAMPKERLRDDANRRWQKLSVAYKWSNLYNSYTIRTKLRTLRAMRGLALEDPSRDNDPLSEEEVGILAQVEHNRWNVEKLLMGYRKPRKEEDMYRHAGHAGQLMKNKDLFVHHDIRPFGQLGTISGLDYELARYIPWLMRMTEE